MSKITLLREAVQKKLGNKSNRQVLIFSAGDLTQGDKPWIRTLITDSDQGTVAVYIVADNCLEGKYLEMLTNSIIKSVQTFHIAKVYGTGMDDEEDNQISGTPTVSKKRTRNPEYQTKKRGRPSKVTTQPPRSEGKRGGKVKRKTTKRVSETKNLGTEGTLPKKRGRPKKINN